MGAGVSPCPAASPAAARAAPETAKTSTPHDSTSARSASRTPSPQIANTGPSATVRTTFASRVRQRPGSTSTRRGCRRQPTSRAVRRGSSVLKVPAPTMTASIHDLIRCTATRLSATRYPLGVAAIAGRAPIEAHRVLVGHEGQPRGHTLAEPVVLTLEAVLQVFVGQIHLDPHLLEAARYPSRRPAAMGRAPLPPPGPAVPRAGRERTAASYRRRSTAPGSHRRSHRALRPRDRGSPRP